MKLAPIPKNEGDRLKALRALCILDTPPEERFDRLTRLAQKITGTPIALVSLVDDTRQWFKSKQGVTACQTDRSISFCGHAIMEDAPFIIENALEDPRFCDNPLVLGDPNIRAYAGIPLRLPNGESAGSFCVIDTEPRPFAADQIAGLKDLAFITSEELSKVEFTENVQQLKRLTEQLQASEKRFRDVSVACGEYIWEADENGRYTFVSSPIESITGYSPERMLGRSLFEGVPEEEAAELRSVMELARKKNKAFQKLIVPYLIRPGRGNETGREPCRWIALSGIPQFDAGKSSSFIGYRGVGLDVTENKEYEEVLERAKEKAEAANHAKSAFLAMMSHEIRTPLNSVVGFTEILKTTELSSDQLEYVNSISSSSEVLLNVINDVLDFSKIEAGRLEIITKPFSIVESIQQVKTLTQAKAVEKR
ncbi:MAG: histidine kinase dimerization/phospho-acceptor domain-containing protein, partial [Verrucomicrobiota bacterium]